MAILVNSSTPLLTLKRVVPSFAIWFWITLSIVTVKSSLVADVLTSVNLRVVPSPTNLSLSISSSSISNGSNLDTVPLSILSLSVVILESSSVPVSNWIPPPTILTKPVASETSVSAESEVNVTVSPSSYNVPASSIITSLTEPPTIPSISIIAFSFPIASIVTDSLFVWSIPSLVKVTAVTKGCTVNVTVKSLVVDIVLIISASENVPSIGTISNIVTESL